MSVAEYPQHWLTIAESRGWSKDEHQAALDARDDARITVTFATARMR